jgi:hypothetical protein
VVVVKITDGKEGRNMLPLRNVERVFRKESTSVKSQSFLTQMTTALGEKK